MLYEDTVVSRMRAESVIGVDPKSRKQKMLIFTINEKNLVCPINYLGLFVGGIIIKILIPVELSTITKYKL